MKSTKSYATDTSPMFADARTAWVLTDGTKGMEVQSWDWPGGCSLRSRGLKSSRQSWYGISPPRSLPPSACSNTQGCSNRLA